MTCEISRKRRAAVTKKQKTATKIMNRKRSAKGSIKMLTLAVPELHKVAKQAAEDIYEMRSLMYLYVNFSSTNFEFVIHSLHKSNFTLTSNKSLTTPVGVLRCPCMSQ